MSESNTAEVKTIFFTRFNFNTISFTVNIVEIGDSSYRCILFTQKLYDIDEHLRNWGSGGFSGTEMGLSFLMFSEGITSYYYLYLLSTSQSLITWALAIWMFSDFLKEAPRLRCAVPWALSCATIELCRFFFTKASHRYLDFETWKF